MNFKNAFKKQCSGINVNDDIYNDALNSIYNHDYSTTQENTGKSYFANKHSRPGHRFIAAVAPVFAAAFIALIIIYALPPDTYSDIGTDASEALHTTGNNTFTIRPFTVLAGPAGEEVTKDGISITEIGYIYGRRYDLSEVSNPEKLTAIYDVSLTTRGTGISITEYYSSNSQCIFLLGTPDANGTIVMKELGTTYSTAGSEDSNSSLYLAVRDSSNDASKSVLSDSAADSGSQTVTSEISVCVTFTDNSMSLKKCEFSAGKSSSSHKNSSDGSSSDGNSASAGPDGDVRLYLGTDYTSETTLSSKEYAEALATQQAEIKRLKQQIIEAQIRIAESEVKVIEKNIRMTEAEIKSAEAKAAAVEAEVKSAEARAKENASVRSCISTDAIMVNGTVYYRTGRTNNVARCGVMDGYITSECIPSKLPSEDNQSNFGSGFGYQFGSSDDTIDVYIDNNWQVFTSTR
ncbi:MAG: hypothetical protein ACI4EJ_05105 [Bacteroides sp.]